jgi:hypothetical protein
MNRLWWGGKGGRTMREIGEELIRRLQEEERKQIRQEVPPRPWPPRDLPTIPYTALAEAPPDSPIAAEWNFYRREVGRLLAEGNQGKWVLIKGEQIVGIWDTLEEANEAQHSLAQPVVLKQILEREPVLRIGYNRLCLS